MRSRFTIHLKRVQVGDASQAHPRKQFLTFQTLISLLWTPLLDRKILIIEDESDVADLLALSLRKAGFNTTAAADGASGLQKARDNRPDFIILDLMLPKMSGLDVVNNLER